MAKYTPMIEQYLSIKATVQDAILFFRLGDFYEMFFDDAVRAAQELEITLTARDGGDHQKVPMCGVPHHSAEQYITKLLEKGYKVAICEQVEDPATAKGVVRREVVRIVTPGTAMEGRAIGEDSNNFIVCIGGSAPYFALVACDLTTGELYQTDIEGSIGQLLDEVMVYSPSEMIVDSTHLAILQKELLTRSKSIVLTEWNTVDDDFTNAHFQHIDWNSLSTNARHCISLLMSYLKETQKRTLSHITRIQTYESKQFMTLDPFTRRNLELVETVRERTKKGSLLWLLDKTVTSMGARLLRRWLDKPLMNQKEIEARHEAVHALYHQLIIREELRDHLKNVYDLERLVGRISYGNANARDLQALKISLQQVPGLMQTCAQSQSETLKRLIDQTDDCSDIAQWIDEAIIDDPPVSIKEGGMIKPGYHQHLDELREASKHGKHWIAQLEKKEREETGIKSLKVGYNKVFGYYIEVTKANIGLLPEGRYERKQTLANAERYVTPELKEKEALILEAQDKMVEIEEKLFLELRDRIARHIPRLQHLARIIAEMDVYQAFATVSAMNRYQQPEITTDFDLHIEEGRHPVVEEIQSEPFISNDTTFSVDEQRILLITGPNMAGKSTYMRQVALICIMAQIGCFVPARKAKIPIIDRIFTRIGAADDLIGGQSTFMVEMMDIQVMTEKATEQSLVIIDELGRGTSTGEGMAIAQAVIEYLHDQIGCKTLVSTHFHELAYLEERLATLRNYCMAVKESDEKVTFLRKLIKGAASTSYGIYCAQIAGLPSSIIDRAYELIHEMESKVQTVTKESPKAQQLELFAPVQANPEFEQVIEQLRNVDLLNMTPLDAMNFVYQLKQRVIEQQLPIKSK